MQEKKDHKNAEYEHFSLTVRDAYDLGASVKFYSDIKNNFTLVFPAVGLFDESFMTNMFCKLLLFDRIIAKKKQKNGKFLINFWSVTFQETSWFQWFTWREKCPNSEFFWSIFSCISTEYRD